MTDLPSCYGSYEATHDDHGFDAARATVAEVAGGRIGRYRTARAIWVTRVLEGADPAEMIRGSLDYYRSETGRGKYAVHWHTFLQEELYRDEWAALPDPIDPVEATAAQLNQPDGDAEIVRALSRAVSSLPSVDRSMLWSLAVERAPRYVGRRIDSMSDASRDRLVAVYASEEARRRLRESDVTDEDLGRHSVGWPGRHGSRRVNQKE